MWLEKFEQDYHHQQNQKAPSWIHELRSQAWQQFEIQGLPTTKDESWKKTRLASFFNTLENTLEKEIAITELNHMQSLLGSGINHAVFVDGKYMPTMSNIKAQPNVYIAPLIQACVEKEDLIRPYLNTLVSSQTPGFNALNTALLGSGLFVHVGAGVEADSLQILHLVSARQRQYFRHLLFLETGAQINIFDRQKNTGRDTVHMGTEINEYFLSPNSKLHYVRFQELNEHTHWFHSTYVRQERDSQLKSTTFDLGGKLAHNEIQTILNAENASCDLQGLYTLKGSQHIDNYTNIEHACKHTYSTQHYRGIIDEKSHAVFNGKIIIHPQSQQVQAEQQNHNLLLSNQAEIDSKPELNIYADDVKCIHGVTVAQLDDNALFYLATRGIANETAKKLLTQGFVKIIWKMIPQVFKCLLPSKNSRQFL